MGRGVNNSGLIDCNQTHSSFLIYILSTFFNLFKKKNSSSQWPCGSNAVDYIFKNDRSNLLPLGETRTRQCVTRGEEITGRGEVEMRQGEHRAKQGELGDDTPLTLCSLKLRSNEDSI